MAFHGVGLFLAWALHEGGDISALLACVRPLAQHWLREAVGQMDLDPAALPRHCKVKVPVPYPPEDMEVLGLVRKRGWLGAPRIEGTMDLWELKPREAKLEVSAHPCPPLPPRHPQPHTHFLPPASLIYFP